PGPDIMKNLSVKLVKVLADNTPQVLAETKVPVLRVGKENQEGLTFGKPAPPLAPGKPIPWPELEGPPFRFEIWTEEAGAKAGPNKLPVAIKIMEPREYLAVSNANYDVATQRFSVWVGAQTNFYGPPAPVELVLSPDVVPGLVPVKTAGAYKQIITKPG